MNKRCSNCAFSSWGGGHDEALVLECRVTPPRPRQLFAHSLDKDEIGKAVFPVVEADWWCGLFKPRTKEADESDAANGGGNERHSTGN